MKGRTFLLLFVPGALLAALLIVMNNSSRPNLPPSDNPMELACYAGQMAVKQKLSDPSTATFLSCQNAAGIIEETPGHYLARSIFEIPDSSGIKRQHGYAVSVERAAGGFKTFILRID